MNILLDMDEVLADFVGAVCKLFDVCPIETQRIWDPNQWGMEYGLSRILEREVSTAEMWETIDMEPHFWLRLQKLGWFGPIVELVKEYDPNFEIVTTPSQNPNSYADKVRWARWAFMDKHIDDRMTLTRNKWRLANPDTILIDDRDSTIVKFIEKGGHGIVFPRTHNSEHKYAADPVSRVRQRLEDICG